MTRNKVIRATFLQRILVAQHPRTTLFHTPISFPCPRSGFHTFQCRFQPPPSHSNPRSDIQSTLVDFLLPLSRFSPPLRPLWLKSIQFPSRIPFTSSRPLSLPSPLAALHMSKRDAIGTAKRPSPKRAVDGPVCRTIPVKGQR